MKKYVYCPFDSESLYYDTEIQFSNVEEITDFSVNYAVLDALSLEYYFTIEFH